MTNINVTYTANNSKIIVNDVTDFTYELPQSNQANMFYFQTNARGTDVFNGSKNSSVSRQDDHEKKNRMDTVKDGAPIGGIVLEIVDRLGLYNYDRAIQNYIPPDHKGKVLDNYLTNNPDVLTSLTVLNMSRDSERIYIPNYNTTQEYTHLCFDSGLFWENFIPKQYNNVNGVATTVQKVGTLGSYIDPASGCNTDIKEYFPARGNTIELDALFCAMIGLGTTTTITGQYHGGDSKSWSYTFSISGVQSSAAEENAGPIIIHRAYPNDDENVANFFSGNASKNYILEEFKKNGSSTGVETETVLKLLLGKQMGDALQVIFTLIYHIRYKDEGSGGEQPRIITLATCDSIVFMTCLILKVPCIFNPLTNNFKCDALNSLVDNSPTTGTPKSKTYEYYPTVTTIEQKNNRQIVLLKAYNEGEHSKLKIPQLTQAEIDKAFEASNFKPLINMHYFESCVLAMVKLLNIELSQLNPEENIQEKSEQLKFLPFFKVIYKKPKKKTGYWTFTIQKSNKKICKDKRISDKILSKVLNSGSAISSIVGELGKPNIPHMSHFSVIIQEAEAEAEAAAAAAPPAAVAPTAAAAEAEAAAPTAPEAAAAAAAAAAAVVAPTAPPAPTAAAAAVAPPAPPAPTAAAAAEAEAEAESDFAGGASNIHYMDEDNKEDEEDDEFSIFQMIIYRLYYYYLRDSSINEFEPFVEFVLSTESKNLPLFPNKEDYHEFKQKYLEFVYGSDERTWPVPNPWEYNEQDLDYIAGSSDYPPDIYQDDFYTSFGIASIKTESTEINTIRGNITAGIKSMEGYITSIKLGIDDQNNDLLRDNIINFLVVNVNINKFINSLTQLSSESYTDIMEVEGKAAEEAEEATIYEDDDGYNIEEIIKNKFNQIYMAPTKEPVIQKQPPVIIVTNPSKKRGRGPDVIQDSKSRPRFKSRPRIEIENQVHMGGIDLMNVDDFATPGGGGRKTRKKTKSSQLRKTIKKQRVKKIKRKSIRRRKPIKKRVNSKNRKVKRKIKNKTKKYKKPKKQKRSRKPKP
jgi:hypothetical protein